MVIPASWKQSELGEVLLSIVGGGTPSKSNPSFYEGDIPWMSVKDMNKNILNDTVDHISEEAVENSSTNVIPSGTPIIATRMSLGKIVVANFDSAINQDLKALFPATGVNRDFLIGWYRSIAKKIEALGTGTTVKGIRLEVLNSLEFPLPPLAEQKVIADKLDTLLAQVETSKARIERIPQILKTFRQSVLAAAVSGKLTEEWRRENEAPAWLQTTLGDVITSISQGWSPKCLSEGASGKSWGVIKTSSVQEIQFLEQENKKLPETLEPREALKVEVGDILTTRAGPRSRCGVSCYVEYVSLNLMICDKVYRYRVKPEAGLSKFLVMQLNSHPTLENIESLKTGISESGMNLTQKKFNKLPLEWPSKKEQTEIVRRVEELFAFADRIEQNANAALERVNNLTQSILAKAFRGELTADWRAANPDLITGENSSEILLDKIKAERERANAVNKYRQKSTRKTKSEKKILPEIYRENLIVDVIDKKGIAKPQEIFDELKEIMDLRGVLKEISLLLEQKIIKELDKDGQQYLELRR